ncbi:class F sortase [Streptomyces sp. H10-C2]|uniref:class F sortase n=1 Tax=unclassified Streptomyces TaxID=2593676 RepID=UPI0024BA6EE1|nr:MULTISPECIES: class F sortase [unclassified Streptomyces]MDJ0339999.1 class F sortase [Streptomyces sp. PH10-H1]MDJ0369364.1 class F sortase [Streptomyces sp. H10-C2]
MPLPHYRPPGAPEDAPAVVRRSRPRLPGWTAAVVIAVAVVAGTWLLRDGTQDREPPLPAAAEAVSAHGRDPAADGPSETVLPPRADPLPPAVPERIRVPAIGVDAPLMKLGLDRDQHLQAPPDTDRGLAGWYGGGATPGAAGAAVLAGHVDTREGPAVFYELGGLHKGDRIEIDRADHRTAVFTVYGIEVYEKRDFPTERIYGATPDAELRVITCGGGFSEASGYRGNVVAYARLTGSS